MAENTKRAELDSTLLITRGCVDNVPPLKPGERLVLGQIFSPEVAKAFDRELERWNHQNQDNDKVGIVEVLTKHEGVAALPVFCRIAQSKLQTWLFEVLKEEPNAAADSCELAQQVLQTLPEDPAIHPAVTRYTVPPTDPRTKLRGAFGCKAIDAQVEGGGVVIHCGDVIGPYRGHLMFTEEYRTHKTQPHPAFPHCMPAWKNLCDSYGVDIKFTSFTNLDAQHSNVPSACVQGPLKGNHGCPDPQVVQAKKSTSSNKGKSQRVRAAKKAVKSPGLAAYRFNEEFNIQEYEMISSAFMVGNMTCLVNDPTINPLDGSREEKMPQNCCPIDVRIGPWVFPIMVATTDIVQGEELAYSYGLAYWETFADQVLDIGYSEKQQQEIGQLKDAIKELMDKNKELELKLKKKRRIVGKPPKNGKRTPSTTPVPISPFVAHAEAEEGPAGMQPARETASQEVSPEKAEAAASLAQPLVQTPTPTPAKSKTASGRRQSFPQPRSQVTGKTTRTTPAPGASRSTASPDALPSIPRVYKWVVFREKLNMWDALFVVNQQTYFLGSYHCARHAGIMVDLASIQQGQGPRNFPTASELDLLKAREKYKKEGLAARDAAFEMEAADERKLREELGALPRTADQAGTGKPSKSRGKIAGIARKRKAMAEERAAGVSHATKRKRAAEAQKKGGEAVPTAKLGGAGGKISTFPEANSPSLSTRRAHSRNESREQTPEVREVGAEVAPIATGELTARATLAPQEQRQADSSPAVSEYLVSLPRQPSGEVIVLDSEGGSQASPLPAEGANGTAESMIEDPRPSPHASPQRENSKPHIIAPASAQRLLENEDDAAPKGAGQPSSPESGPEQPPFRWGQTKTAARKRFMPSKNRRRIPPEFNRTFSDDHVTSSSAKEGMVVVPIEAVASLAESPGSVPREGLATSQANLTAVASNPAAATSCNGIASPQLSAEASGARLAGSGALGREANGSAVLHLPDAHNATAAEATHSHRSAPAEASQAASGSPSPSPSKALRDKSEQQQTRGPSNARASSLLGKRSAPEDEPVLASGDSLASGEHGKTDAEAQAEVSAASRQHLNGAISKAAVAAERPSGLGRTPWSWLSSLENRALKADGKSSRSTGPESAVKAQSGSITRDLPDTGQAKEGSRSGSGKNSPAGNSCRKQTSSKATKTNGKTASTLSKPADREFIPLARSKTQDAAEQQEARTPTKAIATSSAIQGSDRHSSDQPREAHETPAFTEPQPHSAAMKQSPATERRPHGSGASKERRSSKSQNSGMHGHTSDQGQLRGRNASRLTSTSEGSRGKEANPTASPSKRQAVSPSNPAWNSPDHIAKCKQRLLTDIRSPASDNARSGSMEPQDVLLASHLPPPPEATARDDGASSGLASPCSPRALQSRASKETFVGVPRLASPPPALGIWKNDDPPTARASATPQATADTRPAATLNGGICMPPGSWGHAGKLAALNEPPQSNGKDSGSPSLGSQVPPLADAQAFEDTPTQNTKPAETVTQLPASSSISFADLFGQACGYNRLPNGQIRKPLAETFRQGAALNSLQSDPLPPGFGHLAGNAPLQQDKKPASPKTRDPRRIEVTTSESSSPPLPASPPPPEVSEGRSQAPPEEEQPSCQSAEPLMPPLPEGTPPPPQEEQAARQSRWDRAPQTDGAQQEEVLPWLAADGRAGKGQKDELQPWLRSVSTVYNKHKTQGEIPVQGGKRFWDGGLPSPFALSAPGEGENPFPDIDWPSPEAATLASPEPESENPARSYPSPYQLSVQ